MRYRPRAAKILLFLIAVSRIQQRHGLGGLKNSAVQRSMNLEARAHKQNRHHIIEGLRPSAGECKGVKYKAIRKNSENYNRLASDLISPRSA